MLSANPKISIVMPTHNRGDLILETIESVRQQDYPNWELIVVDDGSTDNTENLVNALSDRRILFHKAGKLGNIIQLRLIGMEKPRVN